MDAQGRFDALYRAHNEAILRYARRRTDQDTARDVAAETFLIAWRRLADVPAGPGQAEPWLYGVARRVLANAERSRRRTQRVTVRLWQQGQDAEVPDPAAGIAERARLARTWTAPGDNALPWDPAWTGSEQLSFLWQDHIRGSAFNFTARTQVRVLDTAAPGRNVLSARVLAAGGGKLGFIQTAFAAPRRGPIIASAFRNSPAAGRSGTATVTLVALSARTGQVIRVLAARTVRYRGLRQQNQADGSCQVLGLDATGQHALVDCPGFSRLDHGQLTRLPGPGVLAAAW